MISNEHIEFVNVVGKLINGLNSYFVIFLKAHRLCNGAVALNATRTLYDRIGEFAWVLVLLIGLGFGAGLGYAARVGIRR